MSRWILFGVYCVITIGCIAGVIYVIRLLHKGLRAFFGEFYQKEEIVSFFVRLAELVIILGGASEAIGHTYGTEAGTNWLTLIWSIAGQIEACISSIVSLFAFFAIFILVFLLFHAIAKRLSRNASG